MFKEPSNRKVLGLLILLAFALSAGATVANAATVFGVTATNQLVRFDSATPNTVTAIGAISGLQTGENILAIDVRPATGQLFALGSSSRIYIINKMTGAASPVGSGAPFTPALNGTEFGFDFNPAVDRIRLVSNTGQNLRLNPNDGTAIADAAINPGSPTLVGAAYNNNFNGTTASTLYVYDTSTNPDTVFIQTPPNNGTLTMPVQVTGVNATGAFGFDFDSGTNEFYVTGSQAGISFFARGNILSGTITPTPLSTALTSIAADITAVPGVQVFGLTMSNQLVTFNSAFPTVVSAPRAITGLQSGENILTIDVRPATGQLFGLGSSSRLYVINPQTGAATAVGTAPFTPALSGTDFGMDFNPTVDRIRLVSNTGQNLRLNPITGGVAATDPNINPGTPSIVGSGYTNNFDGATTTTLYNIDSNSDRLTIQDPPNNGTQVSVGSLGVDTSANVGFDITNSYTATSGLALAAFQLPGDTVSKLYSINLATGAATFSGQIGGTAVLRDIAIAKRATIDFDGDGRTDFSAFRPSNNLWITLRSGNGVFSGTQWGLAASDALMPGDYDGDGRTDVAVWRTTDRNFYVLRSSDNTMLIQNWGLSSDEPVARDYDGDGRTDFAVVRRAGTTMTWFILNSSNGSVRAEQWGLSSDTVAPGDYDGDGRADLSVRRGTGNMPANYFVLQSRDGVRIQQWGLASDIVVPGDYDGDSRTDFAVVREGTSWNWFILRSSNNTFSGAQFGTKGHLQTQGDYDGDGRTDISTWQGANFFVLRTSNGAVTQLNFGLPTDIPVASFDNY